MPTRSRYSVVVPTIGRPSLDVLLAALDDGVGPPPDAVIVVDDRRDRAPLALRPTVRGAPVRVLRSGGRGPASARNTGWRAAATPWVAFLDDDVVPVPTWAQALETDLAGAQPDVGGSQGRIVVPRPPDRRPTDWERNVIGLEQACWATADLAYRREVLEAVGGFDPRFPRAFREDADLGLRVTEAGWTIVRGTRQTLHPVRPADWRVSIRAQRQNRDDQLMAALHGPEWRTRCAGGPSRNGRHVLTAGSAALGLLGALRRTGRLGALGAAGWAAGTAELTWRRIAPGPRTPREVAVMVVTSIAIPIAATWHLAAGAMGARALRGAPGPQPTAPVEAVLFDRDGTLIEDAGEDVRPARVRAVPGAAAAVARLRAHGLKVGVVTNQPALARGRVSAAQVDEVHRRVEELIGPVDTWQVCPHAPEDRCGCRKPAPGLVEQAARALGVPTQACVVVGDIGADLGAAAAAGARGILVPTPVTRPSEVAASRTTARDLHHAADMILHDHDTDGTP